MRLMRLKPQGPGPEKGREPPGTTKILHHYETRIFWREKLQFLLTTYLGKENNGTKMRPILHIFYEGPAVAFNTQGSEGQWAGPAVTQTRSSLIRVASKERSGEESNGSRIQFCLTSFNPRTLYFEDSSTGPDQQMWRPCSEKFVGLYTHKIKIKCQMLVFCSIFVT